jgi:hypothetical protein
LWLNWQTKSLKSTIVIEVAGIVQVCYFRKGLITSAKEANVMPTIPRFTQCLVLSSALAAIPCGMGAAQEPLDDDFDAEMATVQEPPNGDFEDGVLDPWSEMVT